MKLRSRNAFRTLLATLSAFAIPSAVLAQTALEPGWTVSPFASGLGSPANGLEYECSTGGFFVPEYGNGRVLFVPSSGSPTSPFAPVPFVDEIALSRDATFLFAKEHPLGPIHMFDRAATPLGSIPGAGAPVGVAFDSVGNFYAVLNAFSGVVTVFPAATLPPSTPVGAVYATGVGTSGVEGIRFDCQDRLFVAEFNAGTVSQVVPPAGPHIPWVSGLNTTFNMAFDPCTNDVFVSSTGTITRVTSPGMSSTFATGLSSPDGLVFDAVGNLYVNEFGAARITKFTTPSPCSSSCLCGARVPLNPAPAMSLRGLTAIVVLLSLAGCFSLRRRTSRRVG